jgi:hypothetical protein
MSSILTRRAYLTVLWLGLTAPHCQDQSGLLVPDRGLAPRADARVQGHDDKLVTLAYAGEPIALTLDASHSSDPDGHVTRFRWLSGTREPVAGSGASRRSVPEDAGPDWPDDVEKPELMLGEGSYAFNLWVTDDQGMVSAVDLLRVVIAPALDAAAQSCVDAAPDSAQSACARCVCSIDDSCRAAVSGCDAACWGLSVCLAQHCPEFRAGDDPSCVTSQCAMFLPAGAAVSALSPCVRSCEPSCVSSP